MDASTTWSLIAFLVLISVLAWWIGWEMGYARANREEHDRSWEDIAAAMKRMREREQA